MSVHSKKDLASYRLITEMDGQEAKAYFREAKHYINFDLPPYFNFDRLLVYAGSMLINRTLADVCKKNNKGKPVYPGSFSNVNYTILCNKDGGFAWRPLQIIHPVLYVDLVNVITEKSAWSEIQAFFERRAKSRVECISLPLQSECEESNRAVQVTKWWDKIEQESLRKALDYSFMFQTDITNCYSSIYTHSLEWALCKGGRPEVKKALSEGKSVKNLGTEIDFRLRQMNQNQTTGIPQGSALMDFIAEIVLGATDIELTQKINETLPDDAEFTVLRYRDDYRIFVNEYQVGHVIMKLLNDVLMHWNMKMNITKTSETNDIVSAAVKHEKLEEIYAAPVGQSYQKSAMRIFLLSKKYPNTGVVAKSLTEYYDRVRTARLSSRVDFEVVISILAMIAYYSPKYIPQVASIISLLIEKSGREIDRRAIVAKIVSRFKGIPNTEFIDIWLQRITDVDAVKDYVFGSNITKVALGSKNNAAIWNSKWLPKQYSEPIDYLDISSLPEEIEMGTFTPVIDREEFQLYRTSYPE